MARRKGELTPSSIDRGWPFQVALLSELSLGKLGDEQTLYCNRLLRCSLGHSIFHEDKHYTVHCFATKVGAEAFMSKFGGEWFDPRDRGRGAQGNRWFKGRAAAMGLPRIFTV